MINGEYKTALKNEVIRMFGQVWAEAHTLV
jgi:hypothetical protein